MQALATARDGLLTGADELLTAAPAESSAPPAPSVPTISPLIPTEAATASASPPRPLLDREDHTFGPQSSWASGLPAAEPEPREKDESTQEVVPTPDQQPVTAMSSAAPSTAGSAAPNVDEAPGEAAPGTEGSAATSAESPPAAAAAGGGVLDDANRQLAAGDVAGALDAMRAIVDRQPDQVEAVIARLTSILHDAQYRSHYEEVRLLLVDAYMVQGDYDRAMSLLHEPSS